MDSNFLNHKKRIFSRDQGISSRNKIIRSLVLLALVPLVGSLGFILIEGWRFLDALYMAIISITTVGFMEVHPLSDGGRIFVICYLIVGLSSFLFALSQLGEWAIQSNLSIYFARYKMEKKMGTLQDHFVVCGYGRMGERICESLAASHQPFVLIEKNMERLLKAREKGYLAIEGEAAHDEILQTAQISNAKGLCAVLSDDADNLLLVMSARLLNPTLQIVARTLEAQNAKKLERAGANRVVNLYNTAALKAFEALIHPGIEDISNLRWEGSQDLDFAEHKVTAQSPFYKKDLLSLRSQAGQGVVIGIKKQNGQLEIPASESKVLDLNDRLLFIGRSSAVEKLCQQLKI